MFTEADIDRIGRSVQTRTLPKSEWAHAAHFAAAMWVLTHPNLVAERDMPAVIRSYNEATGTRNTDTTGYHETITQASIRAARAFWPSVRMPAVPKPCAHSSHRPLAVPTGCSLTTVVTVCSRLRRVADGSSQISRPYRSKDCD